MSSTFLVASGAFRSDLSEPECAPSPSARSTPTAEQLSLDIGPGCPSSETSASFQRWFFPTPTVGDSWSPSTPESAQREWSKNNLRGISASTSSAADSPAKISPSPERVLVLQARGVGSGANTTDSFARFDPATSSWRTSQHCFLEGLEKYSETWPRSGMTRSGTAYRLPTLVPLTVETESGLLPTPVAQGDGKSYEAHMAMKARMGRKTCTSLDVMARSGMWPTPTAQDSANNGGASQYDRNSLPLNAAVGGSLNPTFVEWLMGFPRDWTEV